MNLVRDEYGFEDLMAQESFMELSCRGAGLGDFRNDERERHIRFTAVSAAIPRW